VGSGVGENASYVEAKLLGRRAVEGAWHDADRGGLYLQISRSGIKPPSLDRRLIETYADAMARRNSYRP